MKKIISLILTIIIALAMMHPVYANGTIVDSGNCGTNLTWSIDNNGILTISGTGAMDDYSLKNAPWDSYINTIKSVKIEFGVASISDNAFDNFSEIETVILSTTVTSIGHAAFDKCSKLTTITIPNGATTIGNATFRGCSSLTNMKIPDSVTSMGLRVFKDCSNLAEISLSSRLTCIDQYTFENCISLKKIIIPDNVKSIEAKAFYNCNSLTSVIIPASVKSIENMAFYSCDNLEKVYFKGTKSAQQYLYNFNGSFVTHTVEKIYNYMPATQIELNKKLITLRPEGIIQLVATITPSSATYNYVIWTSSNPEIATVSDGQVIGKAFGQATITAMSVDGYISESCIVTINSTLPQINLFDYQIDNSHILINLSVSNIADTEKLIFAVYDASGKMLEIQYPTLTNGTTKITLPITNVYKIKAFIWDNNINPLIASVEKLIH